ncbi:hypothetical protein DXG03_004761 [Asterophora parasitica]|uniref:Uncharacterized protein n=1 Tax=Asterophora parasitica TaxID=117018 RepID=A0A9P7G8Q9_9AGAR|nr:hypothetical protein DXG03_004761 [Asterophora parasitica]
MRVAMAIFLATSSCRAAFWNKNVNANVDLDVETQGMLMTDEIGGLLSNQDILSNYAQRPDCFRTAAGRIRVHCTQLDMNEGERVNG